MISYITTPVVTSDSDPDAESPLSSTSGKEDKVGKATPSISSSQDSSNTTKPVIILPTYQLRASDIYTSRVPIDDSYSPTDHWQWMATLWRGTVGPDLTIYVKSSVKGEEVRRAVELNEEARCLTVCREGAGFEGSALRRVGFEVGEWIQGIGRRGG